MDYLIIVHLRRHASIQDQQSVSNDYKGYKKNEYKVMTRALLESSSPFVLTFRIMTDDYNMTGKEIDVPVDQYVNGYVKIEKEVI